MTNKWKDGLPPVGEECEASVLLNGCSVHKWVKAEILKVFERECAVYAPEIGQLKFSDQFRPLKTPDEIERERVVELAIETVIEETGGYPHTDNLKVLYDAGLLHDKKVKPLSYQDFIELINKGWSYELMYEDLIENKHILRGSIEND